MGQHSALGDRGLFGYGTEGQRFESLGRAAEGSDEPIPYPCCAGRTGPRTWIYIGGDYTKPGTPVTSITLLPRPFD